MTAIKVGNRAELVRAIKEPGLVITNHWQPRLSGSTRRPKTVRNGGKRGIQTNGYWFDGIDKNGGPCEMWAEIPKASELFFHGDGVVTFHPGTERSWKLAFGKDGE